MDFLWHLVASISILLPNILGYNLIFGKGKILHFGPIGISTVATYATFLTLLGTENYPLAILAGLAGSLLISVFFAWLSLRLEPDGLGVMSIAVHLALLAVVLNWVSLTRGALGLPRIPRMFGLEDLPSFALVTCTIAVVWTLLIFAIDRSAFGRQLAALAEHEWYAKALGISRARINLLAFLLGGMGALITNLFYVQYIRLAHPNDLTFPFLIFFVMVIVAGKPGSVLGVTVSTIFLVLLKEALRFVPMSASILGPFRLMLFGAILFGVVWWRRDTLFPQQRRV